MRPRNSEARLLSAVNRHMAHKRAWWRRIDVFDFVRGAARWQ
jgi:hypothetical protein